MLLLTGVLLGGCKERMDAWKRTATFAVYEGFEHVGVTPVAIVCDNRLIAGASVNGPVLASLHGDRLVAGERQDGKLLATVSGNELVCEGEVVGVTDGACIVLGKDIYGTYVGQVVHPDNTAALMGAAYFRFFSGRTYPERRLTFVLTSDMEDMLPYLRRLAPVVEGSALYKNLGMNLAPLMHVAGNRIVEGADPDGKELGTIEKDCIRSSDGKFRAEFTGRAIYPAPKEFNDPILYIDGDNALAGPLGAIHYYQTRITGGGGSGGGSGGGGDSGGDDDVPVYKVYGSDLLIRNNRLYSVTVNGPVLARCEGNDVYSGEYGLFPVANYSGSYLYRGSRYGAPIAYFWLNNAYEGNSMGGREICSVSGGGNSALALASAYYLGLL